MTIHAVPLRLLRMVFLFLACSLPALAKDTPFQVITWPTTGTPAVRFTFGRLRQLDGSSKFHSYVMDTEAENLSSRLIPLAHFSIYLFDKKNVRVGEDMITLTNVGPGEAVKFQTTFGTTGTPVSISVQDMEQTHKAISMTVNSTPQGAMLKVDGNELGTTPRIIQVGVGKHTLTFNKEGFTTGNFPLDISAEDVSGGTVSYELGAAAFDSIEMRDGSLLNGDLVSISGMDVEIRVGGNLQHIDRNKIKRVMLTSVVPLCQTCPQPLTQIHSVRAPIE